MKLPMPPGRLADALERGRALPRGLPRRLPGLLPDRRRRLRRRGRLRLRHGAHRRHHQRRRPPPLDRRDRGGAGGPPRTSPSARCIGVADELKGQLPVGFVVLKAGVERPHDEIVAEVVAAGARADRPGRRRSRPRSSSSGCRRRARARSCAGRCGGSPTARSTRVPATIDDPAILDEMGEALRGIGYARSPAAAPAG